MTSHKEKIALKNKNELTKGVKALYFENYKTVMKEIKGNLKK